MENENVEREIGCGWLEEDDGRLGVTFESLLLLLLSEFMLLYT